MPSQFEQQLARVGQSANRLVTSSNLMTLKVELSHQGTITNIVSGVITPQHMDDSGGRQDELSGESTKKRVAGWPIASGYVAEGVEPDFEFLLKMDLQTQTAH
ncbi:hypothetical protein EXU30_01780 [Shewanella maritima]|uniref:Uncharacterized protein n=1 Tax=Shewanella maritima TaxID=2520507 RepID=A0A411PDE0_9GAMM|nr:hypothetical protein [Shewanella maritima]QBF81566.1 hypothetical protein EXU30_01780 [Shewanella maritima]